MYSVLRSGNAHTTAVNTVYMLCVHACGREQKDESALTGGETHNVFTGSYCVLY